MIVRLPVRTDFLYVETNFAVVIAVGPDEPEAARLADLLEALALYEPGCKLVLLVNDGQPETVLQGITSRLPLPIKVIDNPRRGRGFCFTGGLIVGILNGLSYVRAHTDCDFVLKLDPDSLVIGPFAKRITALFNRNPTLGLVGTFRKYPDGSENDSGLDWAPLIEKSYRVLTYWGANNYVRRHLQIGFIGRARRIRQFIRSALLHGYAFGDHCQGGGYALSRVALETLEDNGVFKDPLLFIDTPLGEDIATGLLVRAVGLKLGNYNAPGEVFGVKFRGLCAAPSELPARGYAIIHSVKDWQDIKEKEVRDYFRAQRRAASTHAESDAILEFCE